MFLHLNMKARRLQRYKHDRAHFTDGSHFIAINSYILKKHYECGSLKDTVFVEN
jgi:hypothetical protein